MSIARENKSRALQVIVVTVILLIITNIQTVFSKTFRVDAFAEDDTTIENTTTGQLEEQTTTELMGKASDSNSNKKKEEVIIIHEIFEKDNFGQPQSEYKIKKWIKDYKKGSAIKNLKSNKKRVAEAFLSEDNQDTIKFVFYKTGTAYITGKLYQGKKFVKDFKIKLIVHGYRNPVKKYMLGKKNIAKKFKKRFNASIKLKGEQALKLNVKLKKGWKIKRILLQDGKTIKKISNKKTIKNTEYLHIVTMEIFNKKNKNATYYLNLEIYNVNHKDYKMLYE